MWFAETAPLVTAWPGRRGNRAKGSKMVKTMRDAEGVCEETPVVRRQTERAVEGEFDRRGSSGAFEGDGGAGLASRGEGRSGGSRTGVEAGVRVWEVAERFPDWVVWYGRATGRWWAMPPGWCWYADGLVEAGSSEELAERMGQVERARPRFDPDRERRPRPVAAFRERRLGGRVARGAGQAADGRWSA